MKLTKETYKSIAKSCQAFILEKENAQKEDWQTEEWLSEQTFQEWMNVYVFILTEHVIKRSHVHASSIVIKANENSIGMSLDSDGCFRYVKKRLD